MSDRDPTALDIVVQLMTETRADVAFIKETQTRLIASDAARDTDVSEVKTRLDSVEGKVAKLTGWRTKIQGGVVVAAFVFAILKDRIFELLKL